MRRARATVGAVAAAVALTVGGVTGCGGGQSGHRPAAAATAFAWLRPAPPPAGWKVARIPQGSALAYPPGWRPIKTDRGTATVALLGRGERIEGYLNATPEQGSETPANWHRFRVDHNRGEGSMHVRLVDSANDLTFRSGRGSCVIDSYTTTKAAYREIACLVAGPSSSAVVVAAAPIELWHARAATLQRAVSSFVP
jgi:hypothetical protein